MNLSKRWLHDYVNLDVSDQQFADDMTLSGSKVESFETEGIILKRASSAELSQTVCSAHSANSDLRFMIFRMRLRTVFSFSAMIATKLSARIYTRQ